MSLLERIYAIDACGEANIMKNIKESQLFPVFPGIDQGFDYICEAKPSEVRVAMEDEEKEFEQDELFSSGQGSGKTLFEDPTTSEHTQAEDGDDDEAEFNSKEISDNVNSKGEFLIPVKLPATVIFTPKT